MKELTLNPDGSMNIVNPDRFFVLVVNWIKERSWVRLSGKKYYFPVKSDGYFRLEREGGWFGLEKEDLQYCLSENLRRYQDSTNHAYDLMKIFEFESKEEFENAKERNLI